MVSALTAEAGRLAAPRGLMVITTMGIMVPEARGPAAWLARDPGICSALTPNSTPTPHVTLGKTLSLSKPLNPVCKVRDNRTPSQGCWEE